jgi:hypothetical protein
MLGAALFYPAPMQHHQRHPRLLEDRVGHAALSSREVEVEVEAIARLRQVLLNVIATA